MARRKARPGRKGDVVLRMVWIVVGHVWRELEGGGGSIGRHALRRSLCRMRVWMSGRECWKTWLVVWVWRGVVHKGGLQRDVVTIVVDHGGAKLGGLRLGLLYLCRLQLLMGGRQLLLPWHLLRL